MTTAREIALRLPIANPVARSSLATGTDPMAMLIGFHYLYNVPAHPLGSPSRVFAHMDNARVALRACLIVEEVKELLVDGLGMTPSAALEFIGDTPDATWCEFGDRDGAEVADALGDIVYLCYGMALEMGYDLRAVLEEIHAANLTKLGADGQPIYRDDGKVLKGPNYHAPNIPAALGWE